MKEDDGSYSPVRMQLPILGRELDLIEALAISSLEVLKLPHSLVGVVVQVGFLWGETRKKESIVFMQTD